jgi:hypothetical protein
MIFDHAGGKILQPQLLSRRIVLKSFVGLMGTLGLTGCSAWLNKDPKDLDCPLTMQERSLLEQVVFKIVQDALFISENSHDTERAFSFSLLGVDQGYSGISFLAKTCTAATVYEPFCVETSLPANESKDPFWKIRDRCGRYICEKAGVDAVKVYFTMRPRTAPDDRHVFSYDTASPLKKIVYDPNPHIKWRFDETKTATMVVSTDFSHSVQMTTVANAKIDLSHQGKLTVVKTAGELQTLEMQLRFPMLASQAVGVFLKIDFNADTVNGSVQYDGKIIASLKLSGKPTLDQLKFTWESHC